MIQLRLKVMAEACQEQNNVSEYAQWIFEERLAHLIDREADVKYDSKIKRLIQNAHLPESQAYIDAIKYYTDRGLDKDLIQVLRSNKYITVPHNVLIVSPMGSGKSYIVCALGYEACLAVIRTKYILLPDLLTEIALAKVEATVSKLLNRQSCWKLLREDIARR